MTLLLDSAVFLYAGGGEHPLRSPAQVILRAARDGSLDAVISAEVIQELLHRFAGGPRHEDGRRLAASALALFHPVLAIDQRIMEQTVRLAGAHPTASARDLIHVATCQVHELEGIVSPDRDFDRIGEISRVPFEDFADLDDTGG